MGRWDRRLYPGGVAMSVFVLSEAPFCPFMLAQLALWSVACRASSTGTMIALSIIAGAAGGYATLIRPSWLLFTPFGLAIALVFDKQRMRQLAIGGLMLAALAACMLPWWIRNARVSGHFVATTLQIGASLYDGWSPQADGSSNMDFVPRFEAEEHAHDTEAGGETFEYRLNHRIGEAAIDWARAHPADVLRLAWIKLVRIWNFWPNEPSLKSWPIRLAVMCSYVPLVSLAVVGIWRFSRLGWPYVLAWLPAVYFTLLHVIFIGSIRYREPAMLALTVLAAGVLSAATGHASRARRQRCRKQLPKGVRRNQAITKGLVNLCWFFFKWACAAALVAALAASPFFYRKLFFKVEEEVRRESNRESPSVCHTYGSAWSRPI